MVDLGHPRPIEAGSTRLGRWLRERRLRFAVWIALVEGILLIVHAIPRWPALLLAAGLVVVALSVRRNLESDSMRQTLWVIGVSQALVILIPLLLIVVGTLALVALGLLALGALLVLFTERR